MIVQVNGGMTSRLAVVLYVCYSRDMTESAAQMIGFNSEVTECDKCGRMELRGTVILANEEGEYARMGTTCASRELGIKVTRQDALNREAWRAQNVRSELVMALRAIESSDLPAAQMYLDGAEKFGIIKVSEKRAADKVRTALA